MDKNQQCECGGRLMKYGFRQLKSGRYQQFRCVECKKFVVSGVSQHAKELIKKLPKVGPQGGMVPAIVDAKQNIHAEGFNGMGCSARVTSFGARTDKTISSRVRALSFSGRHRGRVVSVTRITFSVRGKPEPQGSAKAFYRIGMKFPVVTSDNPGLKGWRQRVAEEAQKVAPRALIEGPVELCVQFEMPKPKSLPKTRRSWHTKKPDLDKLVRAVSDGITHVLIHDDSQIIGIKASKDYSDAPGCLVMLDVVEG